jgi:hypothetical protein
MIGLARALFGKPQNAESQNAKSWRGKEQTSRIGVSLCLPSSRCRER